MRKDLTMNRICTEGRDMMTPQLIRATEVKVGMYIEGHPGWWPITEVGEFSPSVPHVAAAVTVAWLQDLGKRMGTQFPKSAYVLVGVSS